MHKQHSVHLKHFILRNTKANAYAVFHSPFPLALKFFPPCTQQIFTV